MGQMMQSMQQANNGRPVDPMQAAMRLQRNPEIRSVFSDTRMMREHLQAMMDPQMRAMMMRNVDRAMSNLETVPGGMDALRRLHNDIQDPLWDAMQGQDQGANASQTYTTQDTSQ